MNIKETNSLVELFFKKLSEIDNKKPFLKWLNSKHNHQYNREEVAEKILKLSHQIRNLIKDGDRCLLLSENRPEWLIADIAIMNAGGITVPIFTTYAENDYKYILEDCSPALIIVSNDNQFKKINKFIENKKIISFEPIKNNSILLDEIFSKEVKKKINNQLRRSMPACIIYTSGTSGHPKGVVLSHGGILSNCEGAIELLEPLIKKKDPIFLTWLPLSHSYEHTVQFIQIIIGAEIFYAESLEKLIQNMKDSKPTIMTAVPRFYQNLFTKININFCIKILIKSWDGSHYSWSCNSHVRN
mgnify:FL=1